MPQLPPSTVGTQVAGTGTITNYGPGTLLWGDEQTVSIDANNGSVAPGGTLAIDGTLWLIATGGTANFDILKAQVQSGSSGAFLKGVDGRNYKILSGVIRNGGSPNYFQPIDDGQHRPQNIDSMSTSTTGITVVHNSIQAIRVVAFMAEVDEVYVREGFSTGCSVGLTSTVISCYRTRELADRVFYNGSAWDFGSGASNTPFTVASFTSGVLRLTHATTEISNPFKVGIPTVSAISASATYDVIVNGTVSDTECNLSFVNRATGVVATTPDTNMSVYVSRPPYRPVLYNAQEMRTQITAYINSNIWIWGMWEV